MKYIIGVSILFLRIVYLTAVRENFQPPNIVIIYADDLGWNDVSFHGSPQIKTPNLDALAASGIILNAYYGEYMCTPSRAALMTGKYPMRLGLQHYIIAAGEASALPLNVMTMPEHFRKLGYATHMVGKWHLGYMKRNYTPIYRGFDTFFGYYNGFIDYYDYETFETMTYMKICAKPEDVPKTAFVTKSGVYAFFRMLSGLCGASATFRTAMRTILRPCSRKQYFYYPDLHNGTTLIKNLRGEYATHLFTRTATDIIYNHDTSKPLFLYLAEISPHIGNSYDPLQAPLEIIEKFSYIKHEPRRIHAAKVSAMDDSVGNIFKALYEKRILENSIIIFASDNGGETDPNRYGYSSNYPLRGRKMTSFEGGVRVPALIWSPLLSLKEHRTSTQLMHVTDWLPTLYAAAGGDVNDLGAIDGRNMWDALIQNSESPRHVLLHILDPIFGMSALRIGDLKLINGTIYDKLDGRYGPTGFEDVHPGSMDEWIFRDGSVVETILKRIGLWLPKSPDTWRLNATINCNGNLPTESEVCDPSKAPCLFNITNDACEYYNLATEYPEVVKMMMEVIYSYQTVAEPPQTKPRDPRSHPLCHGFGYVEWLEPEYISNCSYRS